MSAHTLASNILMEMPGLKKRQKKLMAHLLWLFLSVRGRINFEQLGRYGHYNECTFRENFSKGFDFLSFNQKLVSHSCGSELAIAFDPSFIPKSGRHTDGLGHFWSGCAGRVKKGLEIAGFGALDIENNTCMHLCAFQTVDTEGHGSLLGYYGQLVKDNAPALLATSKYLVADAYFSKKSFADTVTEAGMELVSRFRDDAVLRYPYLGPRKAGRGRPRKFAGKVNPAKPDPGHFKIATKDEGAIVYGARVHAKALGRYVKAVLVHYLKADGSLKAAKLYFSTDVDMTGLDVLRYYRARFQIEFLYRDAKQHTGLGQCQSRKKERLGFHFNASLTAVSLAKASHHLGVPEAGRGAFSMASIKMQYFNELLLDRFIVGFGIPSENIKNNPVYRTLRDFGKIAA